MAKLKHSKSMVGNAGITWSPKLVDVKAVKPTPVNYKIKTALGKERLTESLKLFGIAGTVIVNTDMCLIDGNSRLQEEKEKGSKKIWVSIPSRKLSPKEFKEMSAMYDFAKAGEVDLERIKGDIGTTSDFFKKWNLEVPLELLDNMGVKGKVEIAGKGSPAKGSSKVEDIILPVKDERMVQLFFTEREEKEFRKLEEKLAAKFKTANTTQTVLKAFKTIIK